MPIPMRWRGDPLVPYTGHVAMALKLLIVAIATLFTQTTTDGAILFESATIGETYVPYSEFFEQNVPGVNLSENHAVGVRFKLHALSHINRVSGHFVADPQSTGDIYGAIISLDDENDFPDSFDLSASDVLGVTTFSLPSTSDEVGGAFDLVLAPGWYFLMFGAGPFGTSGFGAIAANNTDISDRPYIFTNPSAVSPEWIDFYPSFKNLRFAVEGVAIPEPTSLLLVSSIFIAGSCQLRRVARATLPTTVRTADPTRPKANE